MSTNPFEVNSIEDLNSLSKDEIDEIYSQADLYVLEYEHYQLSEADIEHLEKVIALIKYKLTGKDVNEKYESITTEALVSETFRECV